VLCQQEARTAAGQASVCTARLNEAQGPHQALLEAGITKPFPLSLGSSGASPGFAHFVACQYLAASRHLTKVGTADVKMAAPISFCTRDHSWLSHAHTTLDLVQLKETTDEACANRSLGLYTPVMPRLHISFR